MTKTPDQTLDLRGLKCPLPVLRTRKALGAMRGGEVLSVECTDPMAVLDIPHMVHETGNVLCAQSNADGVIRFTIEKAIAPRLAAISFEKRENVDALIAAFIQKREAEGRRVVGVVQFSDEEGCDDCGITARDLVSGEEVALFQDLGKDSEGCRLDASALARVSVLVRASLDSKPDLVIINRFGKMESEGSGLKDEIADAVASGVPTLVPVPKRFMSAWSDFAGPLATPLPMDAQALEDWWTQVSA